MQYRFPKFVLGVLTRDSVRLAFKSGITAKQIINFMAMHAHPQMLNQNPIIPGTVVDQIMLWEKERDRFIFKDGVLYSQFNSQPDFDLLKKYANVILIFFNLFIRFILFYIIFKLSKKQDLGVLIWDNPSRRVMVVSHDGHDEVRRFWKRHKKT
jgi:transcription initiation factor TFIIH subunit 4